MAWAAARGKRGLLWSMIRPYIGGLLSSYSIGGGFLAIGSLGRRSLNPTSSVTAARLKLHRASRSTRLSRIESHLAGDLVVPCLPLAADVCRTTRVTEHCRLREKLPSWFQLVQPLPVGRQFLSGIILWNCSIAKTSMHLGNEV